MKLASGGQRQALQLTLNVKDAGVERGGLVTRWLLLLVWLLLILLGGFVFETVAVSVTLRRRGH